MTKKSAKSKGFRKQTAKKPYLGKRDIAILCLLVLAVGIGAWFLFHYDDGALKVENGAVVAETENDLIVNGSSTRGRARYYKLGEIGQVEGRQREKKATVDDPNLPQYVFTAEGDASNGIRVNVTCSHNKPHALAQYTQTMMANLNDISDLSAIQTGTLGGRDAEYYFYTSSAAEAEATAETAEAPEATEAVEPTEVPEAAEAANDADAAKLERCAVAYVAAPRDSSLVIRAEGRADTADALPSEEALLAAMEDVAKAVAMLEEK